MPSRVTGGPASAMKRAATPQALSTGMEVAEMNSPQTLRRGNVAFSTSATCQPATAINRAAAEPAGPAPITTTSWSMAGDEQVGEGKDAALLDFPCRALRPERRQLPPRKSRAHAGERVMAADIVGAQHEDQPRAQHGKGGTARFAADKAGGPCRHQRQKPGQRPVLKMMQEQVGGDDVRRKPRQGFENIALHHLAGPAQRLKGVA